MPKRDEATFMQEVLILTELKKHGNEQLITFGSTDEGHHFLILNKLGLNLAQLIKMSKYRRFSVKTSVQICLQLID